MLTLRTDSNFINLITSQIPFYSMKNRIKLIRKLKYWLYAAGIHRIIPSHAFSFAGHLSSLSRWISENRDIGFTDFPSRVFDYGNRLKLYAHLADTELKNEPIEYFEFGVAAGNSFRWWMEKNTNADSKFYGFDTFTGLPEDWGPFKKGAMSNSNELPEINDERGAFYQGLFQQTLHPFLKNYNSSTRKVVLLDADLYSSTLFVLTSMSPIFKSGDIIIFDEFNVPLHEYKAFKEWTESFYIDYQVLGEANNYYHMAIMVK